MHILLTGASSGIGEGLARALAGPGRNLTLVARREDELKRVAASIGDRGKVQVMPCDLSRLEDLEGLVQRAEAAFGPVDTLVNNAGIEKVARTADVTIEEGERLLRVNVLAPLRLIHAVLPAMTARRAGTIVNVTSVAGLVPLPYAVHYSASKAALSSASEHLRLELAPHNINVLTVYPGPIITAMGERAAASYEKDALPRAFWGSVDGLATAVVGSLDRGCARLIYPRMYTVLKWFPTFARWAQFKLAPPPGPLKTGSP
jgi:short-subunit dehydrogenase